MIDLSVFAAETEPVKLLSGEVINLNKPTQKIILNMMNMENDVKGKEPLEAIGVVNKNLVDILNNNADGKTFNIDFIETNFSYNLAYAFIQHYMDWATKIQTQDF